MAFGFHASIEGTLHETISTYLVQGCRGIQTCIAGRHLDPSDLSNTRYLLDDSQFRLYTHSCLTINPAAPMATMHWHLKSLLEEMNIVNCIGATTVVHIGTETTGKTREGSLSNVLATMKALPLTRRVTGQKWSLLLENAAGEGRKFGSTLPDLAELGRGLLEEDLAVGFCIDTAHAYGAGVFDFSSVEAVDEMFEMLDEVLGIGRLQLIHLNDSKVKFGGHADRHDNIGHGFIWKEDRTPCAYLLRECKRRGIDVMLETPELHIKEDYLWGCKVRNS